MKNYVIVAVLAYSLKKDMGWLKLASIDGRAWGDLGAHFDKGSSAPVTSSVLFSSK